MYYQYIFLYMYMFFILGYYNFTFTKQYIKTDEFFTKAPRPDTSASSGCATCSVASTDLLPHDCVCLELAVDGNATIEGNLSVVEKIRTDEFTAHNVSVKKASIDKATINDLTICDLSVTCDTSISDLTADSITVCNLDVTCSGASFVDLTADLASMCDVTVGCDLFMNDSTNPATGNILKNGTIFIHNFGTNNTFIGKNSGNFTLTGSCNIGIGKSTLACDTTGQENIAIGANALASNTTGSNNTAIGIDTLGNNHDGNNNIAIGNNANTSKYINDDNIAIGYNSLKHDLCSFRNVAIGSGAMENAGGIVFCAGLVPFDPIRLTHTDFTMKNCSAEHKNCFDDHLCYTLCSPIHFETNAKNVAIGCDALKNVSLGYNNIAIGDSAGQNLNITTVNLGNNIYIGNQGADTIINPVIVSPEIPVGFNPQETNVIRIGNPEIHEHTFIAAIYNRPLTSGATVSINDRGELGVLVSSERFKKNIKNFSSELIQKILKLTPKSFEYLSEQEKTSYGLIAEEVAEILPELVIYDAEGKPFSIQYSTLSVLLLGVIKNMQDILSEQEERLTTLENYIGKK